MKTFKLPKSLKISKRRWLRGGGQEGSALLETRENGKMCCLGFACRAMGIGRKDILGVCMPGDLDHHIPGLNKVKGGCVEDCRSSVRLAATNDDEIMTDEKRQESIKRQFLQLGVTVEFVA